MTFLAGTLTGRPQVKEAGGQPLAFAAIDDQDFVYRDGVTLAGMTATETLPLNIARILTNGEDVLISHGEVTWSYA